MQMKSLDKYLMVVLIGLMLIAAPVSARDYFSLDEAVKSLRKQERGKVISARTRDKDGAPVHSIRMLDDDGRVQNFYIDGRNGRRINKSNRR